MGIKDLSILAVEVGLLQTKLLILVLETTPMITEAGMFQYKIIS